MRKIKGYLRRVLEDFPRACIHAFKMLGWRGLYLAFCTHIIECQPFKLRSTPCGTLGTWQEVAGFLDNFCYNELRCPIVEDALKTSSAPWIVDVGVNVGVTCRWWLSLSAKANVIGIDMFQEALDFTSRRIGERWNLENWHPICGAVGAHRQLLEVRYSNPLEGTTGLNSLGDHVRTIQMDTLDEWLANRLPPEIVMLKIDIEGSAGEALAGAGELLRRCRYVAVETHGEEETAAASNKLILADFCQFRVQGRTMWWVRNQHD